MAKVSVIIPTRNEHPDMLNKTVDDIFAKADGEIEVIVAFDGPPYTPLAERPNLVRLDLPTPIGMRECLNVLAAKATGEYLFKLDSHCLVSPGYDAALKRDCEPNWIVVPRLYALDWVTGQPDFTRKVDYYYLSCPWNHPKFFQMQSCFWLSQTQLLDGTRWLDDIMAFQGSGWFMPTAYWRNNLHGVAPIEKFGPFAEHQELSLNAWLTGGRVVVNKKCWYAHEQRTNRRRGYHRAISDFHRSHIAVARYYALKRPPVRMHDFEWLVAKFWPLPTEPSNFKREEQFIWPENWREVIQQPEPVTPFSHYFPEAQYA